jgi:hypothetical protein
MVMAHGVPLSMYAFRPPSSGTRIVTYWCTESFAGALDSVLLTRKTAYLAPRSSFLNDTLISPHFRPHRHRLSTDAYRRGMISRFAAWNDVL